MRPACSQCIRLKVQCPGYRNPEDLIFRDQNQWVAQKYHRGRTREETQTRDIKDGRDGGQSLISGNSTTPNTQFPSHSGPNLIRAISFPTEELIIPFFLDYFAADRNELSQYIMSRLNRTLGGAEDRVLSAAVTSVGYAVLSNIQNSPHDRIVARQRYGTAVRLTTLTLQGSIPCDTNSLLAAIILLSTFEVSIQNSTLQAPGNNFLR